MTVLYKNPNPRKAYHDPLTIPKPLLTIGMPHHKNADEIWFVLRALSMYQHLGTVEILIADDSPGTYESDQLRGWLEHWACRDAFQVSYVTTSGNLGPARAKNAVFANADAEWVLCIDSHVLLPKETVENIYAYMSELKNSKDLFVGPMLYDDDKSLDTEIAPYWRGQALGTWHQDDRGLYSSAPYEVYGHGCGLMLCRKQAWLGFNENFYGFGSEEGYIHEKFRKAGHKVVCLPEMVWNHKFFSAKPKTYNPLKWFKVRNYVVGFQELHLSLDPIYHHFVALDSEITSELYPETRFIYPNPYPPKTGDERLDLIRHLQYEHSENPDDLHKLDIEQLQSLHTRHKIPQADWDFLLADPIAHTFPPNYKPMTRTIDSIYDAALSVEKDLNKHLPFITQVVSGTESVVDITRRIETSIAAVKGRPKFLVTHAYGEEAKSSLYQDLFLAAENNNQLWTLHRHTEFKDFDIPECDGLIFKCPHNYHTMQADLARWSTKVRQWIMIHDTETHADTWHDGDKGVGLAPGIKQFLADNANWFVVFHSPQQYGLTLLSCNQEARPKHTIHPWPPGYGPGTELKAMLSELGIEDSPQCDCAGKRNQMDIWGVERCKEQRQLIIDWMREGATRWNWSSKLPTSENIGNFWTKVKASVNSLWSGLITTFNPLDPWPGLVDEAIRRAEEIEVVYQRSLKNQTVPLTDEADLSTTTELINDRTAYRGDL